MINYQFDQKFLEEIIKKGQVMLTTQQLSSKKRKSILEDISTFQRYLSGDYEILDDDYEELVWKDLSDFRDYLLKELKKCYNDLGKDTIKNIISLSNVNIFSGDENWQEPLIPLEDQIILTLKNYQKISPTYYALAEKIINNKKTSLIQIVPDLLDSSYCYNAFN